MRRLLDMADWKWSDHHPAGHTRWTYFVRSGEAVTTALLAAYAAVILWPGNHFAHGEAWAWLRALTGGHAGPWAAMAVALAITGPWALWQDSGSLRVLSMVSQGAFFLLLANTVRAASPPGLLLATLLVCGLWLVVRALFLLRHHLRRGGRGGE